MNTGCSEFENLLAGYDALEEGERARVDAHVAQCGACRALAQTLSELGTALSAEYGDVRAPSSLLDRLGRRIPADPLPKPSLLPAILDMVAWSAVACAGGSVAWFVALPVITFTGTMLYATAGLLTLSGAGITLWAMRESED
ncbi:MAG: zf-HC2 domain-containing protein [Bryobacteraceae bacterium]|jgi:anti-sigma factor RsiW